MTNSKQLEQKGGFEDPVSLISIFNNSHFLVKIIIKGQYLYKDLTDNSSHVDIFV